MKKILSLILIGIFVVTLAACGGDTPSQLDDILDCLTNPDNEGCEDEISDFIDDRPANEILADTVIESWDGDINHVIALFDALQRLDAMEVETEFSFSVMEEGVTNYIHVVMIDNTVETEDGTILHRTLDVDIDGEELLIEVIFQEVPTGVHVFLNFAPLKELLIDQGDQDTIDALTVIGATEDWFMFKFDDSLTNMVEIEVMKDIIVSAFFEQYGETFFYDLQTELDLELTIDPLSTYGIDMGLFVDYLIDEDFNSAELMLDTVDFDTMILDLDMSYLVPEIVILLEDYKAELDLALFDTDAHIVSIQALGTEAWLNSLTEDEIIILADILVDSNNVEGDANLSEILTQYYDGTLDHYLVMEFLNDPDIAYELSMIPGFDSEGFTATMDTLDYDAFYLETVDLEELFNAIYEGQTAFDLYVENVALISPEHASIFEAFSGVVLELEVYKVMVDDLNYAFENLSMFDEFFTLDYYLENDILNATIEKTEDYEILTTVTLEPISYVFIFQDLIAETVLYLDGFQSFELPYIEFINCPAGATCEPLPEYTEMMSNLGMLGEVEYTVLYDPSNANELVTQIDFTDFANKLVMMDETVTQEPIVDLSFKVTMRESEAVVIPEIVSDINMIAEDVAKFSLAEMGYNTLEDTMKYFMINPDEFDLNVGGRKYLDTFDGYLDLGLAFDLSMSYIEVNGTVDLPELSLQLFWHDGTPVFTEELEISDILSILFDPRFNGNPTNEMFQEVVDKVVDENFNMTKLLFVYIFNETDGYIEEPVVAPK